MSLFARLLGAAVLAALTLILGCRESDSESGSDRSPTPAQETVNRAIVQHGGNVLDHAIVTFDFRDAHFRIRRDGGRFHYTRTYTDSLGRSVREVLSNDSLYRAVDGTRVDLSEDERGAVRTAVNSVVYFALLPYFLRDSAVQLDYHDPDTIQGTRYDRVRVTFQQEGGGQDWQDVFMYWFARRDAAMQFLAYAYGRGPDEEYGTRFREAFNVRSVNGVRFADYRNYTTPGDSLQDLTRYPALWAQDSLELVSTIELDSIRVEPLPED